MAEQPPGERKFLLFGSGSYRRRPEGELSRPEIVFVDEHSLLQPYTQHGELEGYLDYGRTPFGMSGEGYSHNDDLQRSVGRTLSKLFSLQERGQEVLEVGYGINHYIADGIYQESGIPVCLLDFVAGNDETDSLVGQKKPAREITPIGEGLKRFVGDMADIDIGQSVLRNRRFASVIFNGSWVAGGNNWTVMEYLQSDYANAIGGQPNWNSPEFRKFREDQLDNLLRLSQTHLTPSGVLYIASSRYAYHGAGYNFNSLPEEKVEFLDLVRRLRQLGAKKLTIVGVSSEGLIDMHKNNVSNPEFQVSRLRQAFSELFLGGTRSSKFKLTHSDGETLTHGELMEIYENSEVLTALMKSSPQIEAKLNQTVDKYIQHGLMTMRHLTGGIDALPNEIEFSVLSGDEIKKIKKSSKDMIPNQIGRIDAIGAEF